MQGFPRRSTAMGAGDLTHLRKSVIWSSPQQPTIRKGALQERLEEILVLELHKDGGRAFLNFTVRGLYKHVLAAITSKISGKRERDEVHVMIQKKPGGAIKGTMGETMASPVVLGALSAHMETSENEDHTDRNDEPELSATAAAAAVDPLQSVTETSETVVPPEIPAPSRDLKPVLSYTQRGVVRADHATYRDRLGGYL